MPLHSAVVSNEIRTYSRNESQWLVPLAYVVCVCCLPANTPVHLCSAVSLMLGAWQIIDSCHAAGVSLMIACVLLLLIIFHILDFR